MYDYRKMTPEQKREAVEYRRLRERPWHSPPHWEFQGQLQFMISSAIYEHQPIIGVTPERMTEFEEALLEACDRFTPKFTPGVYCQITIIYCCKQIGLRGCAPS